METEGRGVNLLAHTNKSIIRCYHQQTVVRLARQQAKHRGAQVPLVSCEIRKANDFGLWMSELICTWRLIKLTDRRPISSHVSFRPGTFETTTSLLLSKPIISIPTELVRPLSISCLCRKRLTRAFPRPSSRSPLTKTPNMVLLPASTGHCQQLCN